MQHFDVCICVSVGHLRLSLILEIIPLSYYHTPQIKCTHALVEHYTQVRLRIVLTSIDLLGNTLSCEYVGN